MDKEIAVQSLTDTMAKFTVLHWQAICPRTSRANWPNCEPWKPTRWPSRSTIRWHSNQEAADKLNRPSCQDTGVIQYFVDAGSNFPLLGELEEILEGGDGRCDQDGPAAPQRGRNLR
jgi:L(+)-tartrate dehydratase alpha subunit